MPSSWRLFTHAARPTQPTRTSTQWTIWSAAHPARRALPPAGWAAMWPPRLQSWNLDEPYPIRSHRAGLGRLLVAGKRVLRAVLRTIARPLLTQQIEINRALALVTLTLADELARERLHLQALEQRLSRVGSVVREAAGEEEPLVVFEEPAARASGPGPGPGSDLAPAGEPKCRVPR